MAPVGQVEFANGIAAMAASGSYGNTLVCAGIVGTADLRTGAGAAEVLDAQIAAGGGRFRGIRFITKWDADEELNTGRYAPPRGLMQDRGFRAGFATACAAQALLRRDGLSPAAPGACGSRARLPGYDHRAEPLSAVSSRSRAPT